MIKDNRGQWILDKAHQQQNNEYTLSGVVEDKVISISIDRTFVDKDGTRWIIDYKTSRHEGTDVRPHGWGRYDYMEVIGRAKQDARAESLVWIPTWK